MSKNLYVLVCPSCNWCSIRDNSPGVHSKCKDCNQLIEFHCYDPKVLQDILQKKQSPTITNSILVEADKITDGEKRKDYGDVNESFNNIAGVWSMILDKPISDTQVALMMIAFKLVRESHKHSRDNLVDMCGYIKLLGVLHNES